MTTPLLLAFALIQAPAAAPQDLQMATLLTEPVLATGIKVEVVETPAVEVETEALPVASTSFVGVTPGAGPCMWANRPCHYLRLSAGLGVPMGDSYEDYMTYATNRAILDQMRYNVGYLRGREMARQQAARASVAANPPGSGRSSGSSNAGASSSGSSSVGGGSGVGRASGGSGYRGTVGGGSYSGAKPGSEPL